MCIGSRRKKRDTTVEKEKSVDRGGRGRGRTAAFFCTQRVDQFSCQRRPPFLLVLSTCDDVGHFPNFRPLAVDPFFVVSRAIFAVCVYFSGELRFDDFQHFVNARFSKISSLIFTRSKGSEIIREFTRS